MRLARPSRDLSFAEGPRARGGAAEREGEGGGDPSRQSARMERKKKIEERKMRERLAERASGPNGERGKNHARARVN